MPEKEYQRLTLARSRAAFSVAFMSRSSLWLGKDHLLCVDSSGYTENYKRFYFRDIQAVIIRATKRRAIWNWFLGAPTAIFLTLSLGHMHTSPPTDPSEIAFYWILASMFALPLFINNVLGPTCICHLRTAVQIEELPSLSRLRRARKVLKRTRPLIAAAQGGQLSPETISTWMRAGVETPPAAAAPETITDNPNVPPVIS
jgi:hypothetical protein